MRALGPVDLNGKRVLYIVDNPSSLDDGDVDPEAVARGARNGRDLRGVDGAGVARDRDRTSIVVSSGVGVGRLRADVQGRRGSDDRVRELRRTRTLGFIASSGKGTVASTTLVSLVDASTPLVSDLMTGVGFKMILDIAVDLALLGDARGGGDQGGVDHGSADPAGRVRATRRGRR